MSGSLADSVRARGHVQRSDAGLNALDFALESILRSNVSSASATLNGTSTILDSATTPSTTPSQDACSSASESTSAIIGTQSCASAVAPSVSALSSAERALSIPKNAAASSPSPAPPSSTPAPSSTASSPGDVTDKSTTLKVNPASSTATLASSTAPSSSTSEPNATPAPEPTSSSTAEPSATDAPAPSQAPSTSVSTERGDQTFTSKVSTSGTNNQESVPSTSSDEGAQSSNKAASPQPSESSDPSANQGNSGNSPTTAGLGNSLPSATFSDSATSHGNSFIGVTASSYIRIDSTLPTPEAVTITSGNSVFTTTPALITSIFVSSGKNGSPGQTFTSVFANPTNVPNVSGVSDGSSFWDNKGAVAGVFIAVALVALLSIFGTVFCWRRRRRRLALDDAQFRRFSSPSEMVQHPTTYQPVKGQGVAPDDPFRHLMAPSMTSGRNNSSENPAMAQRSASQSSHNSGDIPHSGALGLTGIPASPPGLMQEYKGPFSDYYRYISTGDTRLGTPPEEQVGIAVTSDFEEGSKPVQEVQPKIERNTPSPAPSSPSIYPPSLPTVREKDEDDYLFYERETTRRPESRLPTPPPKAVVNDSDPQNPFSSPFDAVHDAALHQSAPQSYRPLTPPDSSSSHSPTTPRFAGVEVSTRSLNTARFSNGILGRSVSIRTEPLPRPPRSPLRWSASGSSLQGKEVP